MADQTPVTHWQKKPLTVSMIQWDGSKEACDAISERMGRPDFFAEPLPDGKLNMWVAKSRTFMNLERGDWAVVELDGSGVYPITEADREAGYEPVGSRAYDPDDAVHSDATFLVGVHQGWHAIRRTDALWCIEHDAPFGAVCGAMVRPAFKFGAYDRSTPPVSHEPCQVCAWAVAAETGTLEAEAARLEPTGNILAQLAQLIPDPLIALRTVRAILVGADGDGEREFDHPATVQLFATVAAHAPVVLLEEACAEGDCEHPEGECSPTAAACAACSLQAGDWAADWAGQFRRECSIPAPCSVLLAIAAHFRVVDARGPAASHPVTTTWLRSQVTSALEAWIDGETPAAAFDRRVVLLAGVADAVMNVLDPAIGRITAETAALVRAEMATEVQRETERADRAETYLAEAEASRVALLEGGHVTVSLEDLQTVFKGSTGWIAPPAVKQAISRLSAAAEPSTGKLSSSRPEPSLETMPPLVCLCGSTRFGEAFAAASLAETLAGKIVLSIGCNMRSDTEIFGGKPGSELAEIKAGLDELHKRKIDLADEVLVVSDESGYYGDSTRSEIEYAVAHGKPVRFAAEASHQRARLEGLLP